MEYGIKKIRQLPRCLECGEKIRYGRIDKKYCCEDCRNRHYNNLMKASRTFRRRILAILEKNYNILEEILRAGADSIDLSDLLQMGFVPGVVTSYHKIRRHDEYSCFDIKYIMTDSRIYSISKIQNVSLTLRTGPVLNDKTL